MKLETKLMKKILFYILIFASLFSSIGNFAVAQSAPDFIINCSPASLTVDPGEVASWNVTVSSQNGFAGNVQVLYPSATGETPGPVQTVAVPSGGSINTVVTMTVASNHATGTFFRRINGISNSLVDSCYFNLIVDSGTRTVQTVDVKANGANGPIYIAYGDSPVISWTSQDSTWCEIEAGGSVALDGTPSGYMLITNGPISGSAVAQPQYSNVYYTLVCSNGSSDVVIVNLYSGGNENSDPAGDIKCVNSIGIEVNGPCTIASGDSTFISWNSSGSDNCEIRSGGLPSDPYLWAGLSGYENTGPLSVTTVYVLSCEGDLGMQIIDSVTVKVVSANLQVSANTSNNNGPWSDGSLNVDSFGQVRLFATCGATGGSGRITPGNINFNGTTHYVNVNFNVSPKTWTLTCYPNPNQLGSPTATDFVNVQLNTPDFTFVCNSLSKTIPAGQSTFFDTTATALNGFNSQVTVSLNTPLPAGVTSTPVTITPTAVASVPVSTLVTSPQGTHNLTFTATGGGKTHTCTSQLNLTAPEGAPELLSLVLTPETANINVGDTQTYTSIAWYTDGTSVNVSTNAATVYTSSGKVATMSSNIATGELEGTVTINAVYTQSGDSVSDSATLIVGAGGLLSATLTCPSGQHTCEIPYGTAINLSWTSTGATSCYAGNGPDLVPPISGTSGTSSTGNLTSNQTYTLGCDDGNDKATDQVTVTVNSAAPSFSTSDKDITAINSVNLSPAPSACSGGTDSVGAVTFKEGDQVSFKINLCNTGSATASGITVVDQLTNLTKPAAGWNAKYNGANITPVESGTAPNKTLTFTIPGTIAVGGAAKTLTFNAIVTKPSGLSNTIYRFQNLARINSDNTNWTIGTPLYIFYAGSRIPSKQEVAP